MIIIINYCDVLLRWSYACILCVCTSLVFILTKCINRLHVSTSSETSLFSHRHTHTYIYTLSCWLAFFSLTYFSSSFHLIVHPHNFLIRFAGRTREHSAARRLLFFLHANASGRLVFCIIVVLLFFLLRLHRRRRRRRRHFILTQLHIHHTNDQQLRIE